MGTETGRNQGGNEAMLAQQVFGRKSLPPGYRPRQVLEAGLLASDRGKVGSSISPPLSVAEPHQGLIVLR